MWVVRYEDLAEQPMKLYKFLYDFAGLEVLENITKWLMNTTHPSESQLKEQARNPVSVVRDSFDDTEMNGVLLQKAAK